MLLDGSAPLGLQIFTEAIANVMHHVMTGYGVALIH
jgi:hypothetical protein